MSTSGARSIFDTPPPTRPSRARQDARVPTTALVYALPLMTTAEHEARIRRLLSEGAALVAADTALLETIEREKRGLLSPERLVHSRIIYMRPAPESPPEGAHVEPVVPGGAAAAAAVGSTSAAAEERV
jgi:hypothetical protein